MLKYISLILTVSLFLPSFSGAEEFFSEKDFQDSVAAWDSKELYGKRFHALTIAFYSKKLSEAEIDLLKSKKRISWGAGDGNLKKHYVSQLTFYFHEQIRNLDRSRVERCGLAFSQFWPPAKKNRPVAGGRSKSGAFSISVQDTTKVAKEIITLDGSLI